MIREGTFREDLYYRLNTVELTLPPLADRPGDIVPLAEHFLSIGKPLSSTAATALQRHLWPGNVRELRNVIQRAELLATGNRIEVADLNLPRAPAAPRPTPSAGNDPDRARIEEVLARNHGVIAQAATELGLSRQALYRRMDRHGIPRE
jgi:DNA-binding NtrC family response regulator